MPTAEAVAAALAGPHYADRRPARFERGNLGPSAGHRLDANQTRLEFFDRPVVAAGGPGGSSVADRRRPSTRPDLDPRAGGRGRGLATMAVGRDGPQAEEGPSGCCWAESGREGVQTKRRNKRPSPAANIYSAPEDIIIIKWLGMEHQVEKLDKIQIGRSSSCSCSGSGSGSGSGSRSSSHFGAFTTQHAPVGPAGRPRNANSPMI